MTAIEWTERTWNPVVGCTKVSPGCANCYIQRSLRRQGIPGFVNGTTGVTLHPDRLDMPLKVRKPTMWFANSMSDLFHEDVPDEFIDRVFATMAVAGMVRQTCKGGTRCQHVCGVSRGCYIEGDGFEWPVQTFQVLTKRPERMRAYLGDPDREQAILDVGNDPEWSIAWDAELWDELVWPLPNVWLGVSAENQRFADLRIPLLLETPAAVRFVSCEPLLGPLDLGAAKALPVYREADMVTQYTSGTADYIPYKRPGRGWVRHDGNMQHWLDWVIVGGESGAMSTRGGPGRALVERCDGRKHGGFGCAYCGLSGWRPKPRALTWVRSIREQCVAAGVPFFFKQWGGPTPKSGGRELDGRTWDEMPRSAVREAVGS